jgi:hypothetical protein
MIKMDDEEFGRSLDSDNARDVYITLKNKMITLTQRLVQQYKDDLSVLFPILNRFEDQCLDGSILITSSSTLPAVTPASSSSSSKGDVSLVDYSNNSVAVFGNTKIIKDALKKIGGRFNPSLMDPTTNQKSAGWVFAKTKKDTVDQLLRTLIVSYTGPSAEVKSNLVPDSIEAVTIDPPTALDDISINTASELTLPSNIQSGIPKIYFVKYSDKSLAVFGEAFYQNENREWFKEIGGKFNKFLSNPLTNQKEYGWIFPINSNENLLSKISHVPVNEEDNGGTKKRKIGDEDL